MAITGKRPVFFIMAAVFSLLLSGCASTRIMRLKDSSEVELNALVQEIRSARAVFVGEAHDERAHHRAQLKVIEALDRAGFKLAVGLEVFPSDYQADLNKWTSGSLDEGDVMKLYYENWSVPWKQYRPILMYAQKRNIPVVGINISRDVIHKVVSEGAANLKPKEINGLEDVRCDLDEVYKDLIGEALKTHAGAAQAFNSFCEAQVVWDRSMAKVVVKYLKENPDRTMVVLAGSAHAWKRGIPRRIGTEAGVAQIVILPAVTESKAVFDMPDATHEDADYIWFEP